MTGTSPERPVAMTQSRRTKSQRQLTPGRLFLYRIAVRFGRLIVETLWRTCRIRIVGIEQLNALLSEHGSVIPVCWHQHLLICTRFVVDGRRSGIAKPGFMISPSVDGEAPTMLARTYGAHVVRGSGSYTGVRAVRGVHTAIVKESISPLITPDGPRGPRFEFKPGAIFTSQISGKAVVPLAFAARPAFVFKTWDKFVLPVPFCRICIAVGEPYVAPRRTTDDEMQAAQLEMQRRMLATYRKAKEALINRLP